MAKLNSNLQKKINNLPKTAGVYLFFASPKLSEGGLRKPIYIGKAINIRDRVKNHFSRFYRGSSMAKPSGQQPSYRDNLFIEKIEKIGFINTDSEIEALILEANLIKKYQPKFNVVWRDDKNYFYVSIAENKEKIPYVYITHQPAKVLSKKYQVLSIGRKHMQNTKYKIPNTRHIGPFVEGNSLKKTLKFLRKAFPYYASSKHPKNKCAWCHLELCPGPNPDLKEYKKNIKKLILILRGKRKTVLNYLNKEMKEFSKSKNFEKAGKIRDKIYALQQVMAHTRVIEPLKTEDNGWPASNASPAAMTAIRLSGWRSDTGWKKTEKTLQGLLDIKSGIENIECYDISNIQGKSATGSMVVFVNGKPDKGQYKKFRIKMKQEPDDIAMLKEILERRFNHPEWKYPQVMLIDGGIAQLNIGIKTKKEVLLSLTAVEVRRKVENIKVVSIAKGREELFIEGQKKSIPLKNLPQEIYNLIKYLDDEAHRFAIAYHKKLRKKSLLK